jgi:hypothetical protein
MRVQSPFVSDDVTFLSVELVGFEAFVDDSVEELAAGAVSGFFGAPSLSGFEALA